MSPQSFYTSEYNFAMILLILTDDEITMNIPKYYYTNCDLTKDTNDDTIFYLILEDLNEKGFESSRDWAVDEKHAKLVLEEVKTDSSMF